MADDYYKILGINKNASTEEIKKAYRQLVQKYHPDKFYGKAEYQEMNEKFKQINEAYQVLADLEKKQMYDQYGSAFEQAKQRGGAGGFEGFRDWASYAEAMKNGSGFGFGDFSSQGGQTSGWDMGDLGDILGDLFGFSGGSRSTSGRANRGKDLRFQMEISFQDAVFGAEKETSIDKFNICDNCNGKGVAKDSKYKTCSSCRGAGKTARVQSTFFGNFQTVSTCAKCGGEGKIPEKECLICHGEGRVRREKKLKIKIPAGINDGQTIVLRNQGEAGKKGVNNGDLYITFNIKPDPTFERNGFNILNEKEISISEAVLGAKIIIKTIEGDVTLKIPGGTKSGQIFKLKDRGIQHLNGRGKGDHLVTIKVKIPQHLSRKQKGLFEELKQEGL